MLGMQYIDYHFITTWHTPLIIPFWEDISNTGTNPYFEYPSLVCTLQTHRPENRLLRYI